MALGRGRGHLYWWPLIFNKANLMYRNSHFGDTDEHKDYQDIKSYQKPNICENMWPNLKLLILKNEILKI